MELSGEDIIAADNAGKRIRIVAGSKYDFGTLRCKVITMNEIKTAILRNIAEQRMRFGLMHGIPTHMRYFQTASIAVAHIRGKTFDLPCKPTQSRSIPFFTVFEQKLRPNANTKKRLVFQAV